MPNLQKLGIYNPGTVSSSSVNYVLRFPGMVLFRKFGMSAVHNFPYNFFQI